MHSGATPALNRVKLADNTPNKHGGQSAWGLQFSGVKRTRSERSSSYSDAEMSSLSSKRSKREGNENEI